MAIDWFTIIAQALNFLILVWLMKRYLYKPILNMIDAREKRITDELASANTKQVGADKQAADLKVKLEQLEKNRADLMAQAVTKANERNEQLLRDGKKVADDIIQKKRDAASADEQRLRNGLGQRVRAEAFLIAKTILEQLANTEIDSQMIEAFLNKLRLLPENEKADLNKMFTLTGKVTVSTAFELSNALRDKISQTLETFFKPAAVNQATGPTQPIADQANNSTAGPKSHTTFKLDPALVNGIELAVGGKKVAWNISNSLDAFAMASG